MSEGQKVMCAKLRVTKADKVSGQLDLAMTAVCKAGYGDDGSDENNTYAKFTPSADLTMIIQNPDLVDKFSEGQEFYLDFTEVE